MLGYWGLNEDIPFVCELVAEVLEEGGVVGGEKEFVGGSEKAGVAASVGAADYEGGGFGW